MFTVFHSLKNVGIYCLFHRLNNHRSIIVHSLISLFVTHVLSEMYLYKCTLVTYKQQQTKLNVQFECKVFLLNSIKLTRSASLGANILLSTLLTGCCTEHNFFYCIFSFANFSFLNTFVYK